MSWVIALQDAFVPEFEALPEDVRDGLAALFILLRHSGPHLGRPRVDTLKGSRHANMKELRLEAGNGVWCLAFGLRL